MLYKISSSFFFFFRGIKNLKIMITNYAHIIILLFQAFMMNQVVWPYQTGEIIVQNYNAVLTLSNLYQTADAIMVMENDELHKICTQLLGIKVWNVELTMYSY